MAAGQLCLLRVACWKTERLSRTLAAIFQLQRNSKLGHSAVNSRIARTYRIGSCKTVAVDDAFRGFKRYCDLHSSQSILRQKCAARSPPSCLMGGHKICHATTTTTRSTRTRTPVHTLFSQKCENHENHEHLQQVTVQLYAVKICHALKWRALCRPHLFQRHGQVWLVSGCAKNDGQCTSKDSTEALHPLVCREAHYLQGDHPLNPLGSERSAMRSAAWSRDVGRIASFNGAMQISSSSTWFYNLYEILLYFTILHTFSEHMEYLGIPTICRTSNQQVHTNKIQRVHSRYFSLVCKEGWSISVVEGKMRKHINKIQSWFESEAGICRGINVIIRHIFDKYCFCFLDDLKFMASTKASQLSGKCPKEASLGDASAIWSITSSAYDGSWLSL